MRLNLIFGFLGSGKTTLVRHILSERVNNESTAVIVNEFGDVGIDGKILEGNNIDMVQLNSGCLCCTLKGSLISAIEEIKINAKIDRIIIEASGVAEPSDLLDSLWDPNYGIKIDFDLGPVIAVVDAPKFKKMSKILGNFYSEQVAHADIVLLNKIDNAGESDLESLYQDIETRNPNASLFFTEQCSIDLDLILDGKNDWVASQHQYKSDHFHDHSNGHDHGHHHPQFDSLVLKSKFDAPHNLVKNFFKEIDPKVFRAKGFMKIEGKPCLIQFSTDQLDIHPFEGPHSGQVVFIGQGFDRQVLQKKFEIAFCAKG